MRRNKKSILKTKCDSLFSKIVRSIGYCERCGKSSGVQLQNAHINSRRFLSTRWEKDNCVCLCASCHRWGHDHPTLFTKLVERLKGKQTIAYITERAKKTISKMTLLDYEELYAKIKKEHDGLQ